ncbi:MAG: protein kinase [Planctomycetes bacterium]|nr:protein kinase [Planctomycetota bacterium]
MILCKSCNFENPDGLEFCDQCHAPLQGTDDTEVSGDTNQSSQSLVGQVIGMRYIITADATDFSFGDIFDAEDASDDSAVSLCVLPDDVIADEGALDKLKAAAGKVVGLSHENLLSLLDVDLEGDRKFIVLEKTDVRPLADKIAVSPLSVEECLAIFTRTGEALDYVHSQGLIHGDVEPDNILLDENSAVKLSFPVVTGIIKDAAAETAAASPFKAGEQLDGKMIRRSDIYSFAACIYISLGGYLEDGRFMSLGILSEAQNTALRNALGADPLCRQSTCAELLKDMGVEITSLQWKTAQLYNVSISGGDLGQVFLPTRPNAKFDPETEIVIKAVPNDHYQFVGWTGSAVRAGKVADENSAVTELVVDADYTLIADFQIDRHELVLSSSQGGMILSPEEGTCKYDYGRQVELNAQPDENQHFVNWSGTAVDSGNVAEPDSPVTSLTIEDDCTIHANFAVDTFSLSLTCSQGGIVRTDEHDISADLPGGGEYVYAAEVAVTAEPDENYTFVEWTGTAVDAGKVTDPSNPEIMLTIEGQYTLNAVFVVNTHSLKLSTSGSGMVLEPAESQCQFDHGLDVPLRAVADEHSHFAGWIGSAVDAGKVTDPSSSLTTLMVDGDYSLEAIFEVDRFAFDMSASEGGDSSVEGTDDGIAGYEYSSTVTIAAKARRNYHFVEWTGPAVDAGNVEESSMATTTVKVGGDYSLCAVFEIDSHALSLSSSDGGSVIGPREGISEIDHGSEVLIKAEAHQNYHFVNWTGSAVDNGKVEDVTNPVISLEMDDDHSLEAVFAIDRYRFILDPADGGSIKTDEPQAADYEHGTAVAVTAASDENYHFVEWAGTAVDARKVKAPFSKETVVTIEAEYTLHAVFALDRHVLNLSSVGGGCVRQPCEGFSEYDHGKQLVVKALADENHHFVQWSVAETDEDKLADKFSAETTITIDSDVSLEAIFEIDQHALKLSSTGQGEAGTVDDYLEQYVYGRKVAIEAVAADNHHFVEWTGPAVDNGWVADPKSVETTVAANGEMQVEAVFAIDEKTLIVSSEDGGLITLPGRGQYSYSYGEQIVIECCADEKYHFAGWTGPAVNSGRVADPDSPKTTVRMEGDYKVNAVFEKDNLLAQGLEYVKSILDKPNAKPIAAAIIIVILLISIIISAMNSSNDTENLPELWQYANSKAEGGDFDDAIDVANFIIAQAEDFAEDQEIDKKVDKWENELKAQKAWLEVELLINQSKYGDAFLLAKRLISKYPDTTSAKKAGEEIEGLKEIAALYKRISNADDLMNDGKLEDAMDKIVGVLKDFPDDDRAKAIKAQIEEKMKSKKKSGYLSYADNCARDGKWGEAIKNYWDALEISADDEAIKDKLVNACIMQAGIYEKNKDYEKAIEYYTRALIFKETSETQNKLDLAKNAFRAQALANAKVQAQANAITELSDLADRALQNREYDVSIRIFEKIKKNHPKTEGIDEKLATAKGEKHDANLEIAHKRERAGRYPEALAYYREALVAKTVKSTQTQLDSLIATMKKMDEVANKRLEIINFMQDAKEAEEKGDTANAFRSYEKAATAGSLEAMVAVGTALYDGAGVKEDAAKAVEWFKKANAAGYTPAYNRLGLAYAEGKGKQRNLQAAFELFKKGANSRCGRSMYYLSKAYHNGEGIEKDLDLARDWLVKSANKDDVWAMHNLAMLYSKGTGMEKNLDKAVHWFKKAADAGDVDAMYNLGVMYFKGDGVEKNETKGMLWFTRSAENGSANAKIRLGFAYFDGTGVVVNYPAAGKWLTEAAKDGNTGAMDRLGDMYLKGLGVDKAVDKAFKSYTSAAQGGNTGSMHKLGVLFFEGTDIKQDYKKAVKWFSASAGAGNADSIYYMGVVFNKGLGVEADKAVSVEWLTEAAKEGHVKAMHDLAVALNRGEGISTDAAGAFKWFEKAAKAGSAQAACQLGVMYEEGAGVEQDTYESVRWYQKAAKLGNEMAKERLVELNEIW